MADDGVREINDAVGWTGRGDQGDFRAAGVCSETSQWEGGWSGFVVGKRERGGTISGSGGLKGNIQRACGLGCQVKWESATIDVRKHKFGSVGSGDREICDGKGSA